MKKMRNCLILVLVTVLAASMLSGCGVMTKKYEELAGTWTAVLDEPEEQAMALLESIEAYEEEIALADLTSLDYVKIVKFDTDKNYRFEYDIAGTKACVRTYYEEYFADLFAGRETLNEAYSMEFGPMSEAEFQQFYADLYGFADMTALLDHLADTTYDWDTLAAEVETGTFGISGGDLMLRITGDDHAESLGYKIEGNTLTLTYVNGVEVYSKG